MNRFAVIPTRGDRDEELCRCIAAIQPQVDMVIVVDNSDNGRYFNDRRPPECTVVHSPEQPPNLSRLWNLGIDWARAHAREGLLPFIAVLNDDAIVPTAWFAEVEANMREFGCYAGAFADGPLVIHREPGVTALDRRMPGYAFIIRGNLRADERLRWWCGDNDLDMQARQAGGTVLCRQFDLGPAQHLYPDQSTRGVLAEQAALDMATFVEKWGFRPWIV